MKFYQCGQLRTETSASDTITTYYRSNECSTVEKSTYFSDNENDVIVITHRDGLERTISKPMNKEKNDFSPLCDVYNAQYGIAISYDGKYIYTSQWEGGVYCFDTENFKLIWRISMGSVEEIFTVKDGNFIYCHNDKKGLVVLDAKTGEQVNALSGSSMDFYRLDEKYFLAGPKRNSMSIYCFNGLSEQRKIKCSELISDDRTDWIFRNAWLEKNVLCLDAFTSNAGMENIFRYEL